MCTPARTSMPRAPTASAIAEAQRTARAGPSNVAKNPSPAVPTSTPRNRRIQCPDRRVVPLEEVAPRSIAHHGCAIGRTDDVGEDHGGEHPVELRFHVGQVGEEAIHALRAVREQLPRVFSAGKLEEDRAGDVRGGIPALLDRFDRIVRDVGHERRRLDQGGARGGRRCRATSSR